MNVINRPANNLLTHRLTKGLVKTEHWSYALKLLFTTAQAKAEFIEKAYCQMLFYFEVPDAELKSTEMYRVKNVIYDEKGGVGATELYIKIPTPKGEYIREFAINFFDMYGYLIASHNNSV